MYVVLTPEGPHAICRRLRENDVWLKTDLRPKLSGTMMSQKLEDIGQVLEGACQAATETQVDSLSAAMPDEINTFLSCT